VYHTSKPLKFIHIPAAIAQRTDLSSTEKLVLGVIWYYIRKTPVVKAGNTYIGSCIGHSGRSVKNIIYGLKEKGIITVKLRRNSEGKVWAREFTIPDP
jgi:hypothetical protein